MSVSVAYNSSLTTAESLSTNATHQVGGNNVQSQLNTVAANQGAASVPPCTKRGGADLAMTSGTASINLTAVPGTNGVAVDGTGLRVRYMKIVAPATNGYAITIAKGASNGYDGFGAAFSETLAPGDERLVKANAHATIFVGTVIGSSNKIFDVTGTGSDVLSYEIIMG